jgi:hypothetical protein
MKTMKWSIALLALFLAAGSAMADRGHRHHGHHHGPRVQFGISVGPAFWDPWYPRPYYRPYYAPIVIERSEPPVYIQQQAATPPAAQATGYWYYCVEGKGYYPYVKECPGGWQKVLPEAPRQ